MKKLRLDVEQVSVERFETLEGEAPNGTVLGQDAVTGATACYGTCLADSCVTGSQRPCPYCP